MTIGVMLPKTELELNSLCPQEGIDGKKDLDNSHFFYLFRNLSDKKVTSAKSGFVRPVRSAFTTRPQNFFERNTFK